MTCLTVARRVPARGSAPHPLPRTFYSRPAKEVARDLVGASLCHRLPDAAVRRARIVETEAYVGEHDAASHARFGLTPRNKSMWGPPGHAYVYFVYGMHHCLNVVTSFEGDPQAVLLRAAEPLDGWAARLSGPALLADGFGIERADDGADLLGPHLWLEAGAPPRHIVNDHRIGVAYAGTWATRRLRFLDAGSPAVSRPPSGAPRAAARLGTVAKALSGKRRAFKQDRGRSRDG